jgi:arabinan endo-1,5-alpha-L-arabinosidase
VASPHRYAGETQTPSAPEEQAGDYKVIFHQRDNNTTAHESALATLHPDGTVSGAAVGTWSCADGIHVTLTLDGMEYKGVFAQALDSTQFQWTLCFTAMSSDGAALWGSRSTADIN